MGRIGRMGEQRTEDRRRWTEDGGQRPARISRPCLDGVFIRGFGGWGSTANGGMGGTVVVQRRTMPLLFLQANCRKSRHAPDAFQDEPCFNGAAPVKARKPEG